MKLSLKAKLVTVTTIAVLGFGGASVWHWHSNEAPPKHIKTQQNVKEKKAAPALATSRVRIPKSTSKAAQKQPAKLSQSSQEKKISGEEWAQFEKWLAELEQYDEQPAEESDSPQSKQDETDSPALSEEAKAKYQELNKVFVQMNEINEDFRTAVLESNAAGRDWQSKKNYLIETGADELAIKMEDIKFAEKEHSFIKKLKDIYARWINAYEQIDQILPGALVAKELDDSKKRIKYSINREYIESILGKMPADVESDFLPHANSRNVTRITAEQLEKGRVRLERLRESINE